MRAFDKDDTDALPVMAPIRMRANERAAVEHALKAMRRGDFSVRVDSEGDGVDRSLADLVNDVVELNQQMAAELRRIRRVVGSEGRIRHRASTEGFRGEWARSLNSVNELIADLTEPTIEIDRVLGAVAKGDLTERMSTEVDGRPLKGEFRRSADRVNTMVDQLNAFASEVTRVAREVGTEGKLGGQAEVRGVAGTWKDLTDNVNFMASNLTSQVRNIAEVTTAVAKGDLSRKITVDVRGEILELKDTINTMVDQLNAFASEVTRVAHEVGTEGKLGGQAEVRGVAGTWKDLTDNVNSMAGNLTGQVRNIAEVTTAVAKGDLSRKITVDVQGEILELKDTINTMVDQLSALAGEVTRVAHEVGTEGKLGGQADVPGVAGTWKDLTDNINVMSRNLTARARNIAEVTTAVAMGDLSHKITVDVRGEFLIQKDTINTMVDQLNAFAAEVTRVAREVGTEGKLGGQADVRDIGGTWRDLTDNVNQLAANLTTQVRAMETVATAVTRGDLTRSIDVEAQGEVGQLKDSVNEMIRNLRDSTQKSQEQDWLKTSLAHFSRLLQGQRNLRSVGRLVLSELAPLVDVQRGAFYVVDGPSGDRSLRLVASYAADPAGEPSGSIAFGEGLIGQSAEERQRILVTDVPSDYIAIKSALGGAAPVSIVVLPLLFEGETRGVVELASFHGIRDIHLSFLDQLAETLGSVLNTISTNMRAEELVQEQAGRAEAEAGLARLRQVVDVMPEAILLADATGRVYLSNAAAAEIMGTVPAWVIPEPDDVLTVRRFDGSPCPPEEQPLARAVFGSEVVRGEQLIVTNTETGREVPILVNSAPLSDALGSPAGGVAVFQDITPLRDLDRQKDEFLAAISHDLKTPATIIKGRANLLQRALQTHPENIPDLAEGLEAIDDTTAQLVRIVDELLDQTRVRMGQPFELDRGPADLLKIARRLASEYQNISPRHVIRVESPLRGLLGDWDEARMERVVANLISNGVKYSPQGGEVVLHIDREEREGELYATMTVADHGMGIPPDELDRIFEPYFRGSNVARTVTGTGVGLAGARHIVEQHGGTISVESTIGKATTFSVCLPVIREPAGTLEV